MSGNNVTRAIPQAHRSWHYQRRAGLAAALCTMLLFSVNPGSASADELTDRRSQLNSEIAGTRNQVDEFSGEVAKAVAAYDESTQQLAAAEAKLAKAEAETAEAKRQDDARASELAQAEAELKAAKDEVDAARAALAQEKSEVADAVRETLASENSLTEFALFLDDLKTSDIGNKLQYSETVFNIRSGNLDRLTEAQFRVEAAEQRAEKAKTRADEAKTAAAAQLKTSKDSEDAAAAARSDVAALVTTNAGLKQKAEAALAGAKDDLAKQEAEGAELDRRIQERVAEQQRQEAERAAAAKASAGSSSGGGGSSGGSGGGGSSSSGLAWPAIGKAGSPFGMRFHPILHYSRMHWGTDIGAACGSPLYAAADGVMTEVGWNGGYGNHAVLDIGKVNGSYLSVGYAHATRYVVSSGDHVSKGQVIGYVGTTGLSTGCHLHLEIWQNGKKVDPMKFY